MPGLSWTPPEKADNPAWLELLVAIEAADHRGEQRSLAELDDEWASIWAHPRTDSVFVWDGARLVAFGWLKTQAGTGGRHKISCWGGVDPSYRARGIGRELLDLQVARAREIATTLDPASPVHVEVDASAGQRALARLAERAGFEARRTFLEVVRPVSEPVVDAPAVAGLELGGWASELDEPVRLAHIEAFADHWGAQPRSSEEWRQWHTGHRSFRPDLSRLVWRAGAREVVAFVLVATYETDWVAGPREAWIQDVGTVPAWRGRGVARWAVTGTLQAIASAPDAFERAILGVDAENPTGAVGLYRSLDFVDERASVRFVLEIPAPAGSAFR
jgi:ribosomal protein S18 acetylase RimI-like enzyme